MYDHSSPPRQQPPPSVAPPPPTSSIWAPQPLAGDTAWPRGIEAFSRSPLTREDLYASLAHGAIGDGRGVGIGIGNKNVNVNVNVSEGSPDLRADSHVEQLFRTLNLNSPEPMLAASLSRASPGSAVSVGSGRSARSGHSSNGSGSGGVKQPRPSLTLDLSFATSTSTTASTSSISNNNSSINSTFVSTTSSSNTDHSQSASAGNMSSCSGLGAKVDGDVDGVGGGNLSMVDTSSTSSAFLSASEGDLSIPSLPSLTNSDSNNSATVSAPLSTAVAPTAAPNNPSAVTNNNTGDAEDPNAFVYPQLPDFSPLSISSVLLTPLDSPRGHGQGHGGLPLSPTQAVHSPIRGGGGGQQQQQPSSMPSPIGHPPGMHSPMGQGQQLYSPTHGQGLMHSPTGLGAMFKERERAPTYEPVSPFAPVQELVGVGHERLQTLGGGNGNGGVGFGLGSGFANTKDAFGMGINAHAHAHTRTHTHTHNHANGSSSIPTSTVHTPLLGSVGGGNGNGAGGVNSTPRFVSLPSTPLQMPSSFGFDFVGAGAGGGGGGGGAGGIEGQGHQLPYYQHQHQHARGMSAGAIGLEGGGGSGMGLDYRSDWLRAEDGMGLGMGMQGLGQEGAGAYRLGLGLGSGMGFGAQQQQQQRGLGLGFVQREGGGAAGMGTGSLYAGEEVGMSPRGSAALGRSAFGYQQQQQQLEQAQQHLRTQRLVQQQQQQAQRQPQQDPFGALWDLRGGSEGTLGGGGGVGATAGTIGDAGGGANFGGGHGQGHGHGHGHAREGRSASAGGHEPINFLSLLHPASSPPYAAFVARIIKSADQQASIFLQQKLKVAGAEERARIVDAICARGGEMMMHRFGNWAVQRCLEAATGPEERRKIVACMRGRIVDLATNCYGCHVLQKALDCEEEEVRLLIVSELLMGDPAQTLVNKHASHVWSKIMELSWTPPAPPIFAYVNKSLKGKWAALACHETGSLVVQHAFENLEETAKDGIVDELLGQGITVFGEVAKSQWGSYCIQHILEHGSENHRQMALEHLLTGLLEFATNEQGSKSVVKALKEGGKGTLDRVVGRMCEPAKGARRAMIVDLALSLTGSQLIASVLPTADKDQRALLYDCIRGHIVTLRGCKTGSKVIWLFDRMRAYYGY
ncbi:ARM repeat-containing protein [Favolaschia claudopus]|uniref:ARM repeat-containing protein n=1 Tax=Favolaschia claudopus TaxID=2862362 RepID=A0AAV9Z8U8_9AGAR